MIVVFVVDTSPSMAAPISPGGPDATSKSMLSRLDLAKMAVEDLTKGLTRRIQEHNVFLQQQSPDVQKSMCQIGLGYAPPNQYLLLSTSRQHTDQPATAACGAGGRLLVGFGPDHVYSSSSSNSSNNNGNHNNNMDGSGGPGGGLGDPFHNDGNNANNNNNNNMGPSNNTASFQRELKQLQAAVLPPTTTTTTKGGKPVKEPKFPDDAGGAGGLNAALSAGLQLLSRYRLHDRATENFGMGRLPNPAMVTPTGTFASHALQPACLILLTDGACLRKPPADGGGPLQLQYGSMPLREFYKEPFRWDQRVICLGIGANSGSNNNGVSSTQYLHPHLRALCEVTGGHHSMLQSTASLGAMTDRLLRIMTPPLPRELPLPDPLKSPVTLTSSTTISTASTNGTSTFINGGPVCCFQALEGDMDGSGGGGGQSTVYRAMILYVPCPATQLTPTDVPDSVSFPPPLWCIPENFFPSRKLDTLPPRPAQPMLMISRFPSKLGNKSFEPTILIKQLHRLDQLILTTKQLVHSSQGTDNPPQPGTLVRMLHRDVYICEWVSVDDRPPKAPQPNVYGGSEYFPVMVQDAGRPTSADDAGGPNYFHIGILHAPASTSTLATSTMSASSRPFSTLTLLPPEPQLLIPLLLKAADAQHRALKKAIQANSSAEALATIGRTVHVDDAWKQDLRHYVARLPPYYQTYMKRGLRAVLPTSLHPVLATILASESAAGASGGPGGGETALSTTSLSMQSFSKLCFQKIRTAEQGARDTNERLERQEAELRGVSKPTIDPQQHQQQQQQAHSRSSNAGGTHSRSSNAGGNQGNQFEVGYGQYDPRSTPESFLSSLRSLPAPWLVGVDSDQKRKHDTDESTKTKVASKEKAGPSKIAEKNKQAGSASNEAKASKPKKRNAMECLGDLPANCLMAYYESRRRWIFGGSGLTTRGLMVEGVSNDGSNSQRCSANPNDFSEQSLLSLAGVGVATLNETTVAKMGDYRERLLWSRSPVVGYGANDSCGVAATTAADGSPKWSVDDDAMPMTFFDPKTGEFADSVQARVRSRLMVNFGNAYKDKRADSLVPEQFISQCPSNHQHSGSFGDSPQHGGSPPHDSYSSGVEEGEALFTKSPPPKSPPHTSGSLSLSPRPPPLRPPKRDSADSASTDSGHTEPEDSSSVSSMSPPPPPPNKKQKLDGDSKTASKPTPSVQRTKRGSTNDVKYIPPSTPTTPPVAPPKMKSSPGSSDSGGGMSPKPPPPPPMSPKAAPKAAPPPTPTPKGSTSKKPPPPPGGKKPPPPPSLDKRPSFNLAPSKPLPSIPLRRPSSTLGAAPPSTSKDSGSGSDLASKKLPPPPSMPMPSKLEKATSGGSTSSASSATAKKKPPPPGPPKQQGAPPPPAPRQRSASVTSVTPPAPSAPAPSSVAKPPPPKPPQQQQVPPPPQQQQQQAPPSEQPLEYTNKDKKPNVDLPAGWMCVWSKSQTRWYFFDTRSNKSVWEWPPPPK